MGVGKAGLNTGIYTRGIAFYRRWLLAKALKDQHKISQRTTNSQRSYDKVEGRFPCDGTSKVCKIEYEWPSKRRNSPKCKVLKTITCKVIEAGSGESYGYGATDFADLVEVEYSQNAEVKCHVELKGISGDMSCRAVAQKVRL